MHVCILPLRLCVGKIIPVKRTCTCMIVPTVPVANGDRWIQWRKPGAELGGTEKFSRTKMTCFSEKNCILAAKIYDNLLLVIDQVFRIFRLFSLIFRIFTLLDIVHNPFLTRKTPFFPFWRQQFRMTFF